MRNLLMLLTAMFAFACGGNQSTEQAATQADNAAVLYFYGDTISDEGALNPADMLAMMQGKDSIAVKMAAPINQTCRAKGCWMTLDMGDEQQMRVRFKDYGFFVPTEGAEGKLAIVEGYAFIDTISVDHLRHLAEDAGKTEEEIAMINTPEISINFEAHGVIIKE